MRQPQSFIEKCYKDQQGRVVLAQTPNLPVAVGLVSMAAAYFIKAGLVHNLLAVIAFGALFTWAWLELFAGVNYFRRAIGAVALFMLIYSRV